MDNCSSETDLKILNPPFTSEKTSNHHEKIMKNPTSDVWDFLPRPITSQERGAVDGIPTDGDPLPSRLQGLRK